MAAQVTGAAPWIIAFKHGSRVNQCLILIKGAWSLISNNKVGRPSLTLRCVCSWGSGSFDSQICHSDVQKGINSTSGAQFLHL